MASCDVNVEPSVDVCVRRSGEAAEIFVSAHPRVRADAASQAMPLLDAVAEVLRSHQAVIFQERIFACPAAMEEIGRARVRAYGNLQDLVQPTWLAVPENDCGPISGIQVHAVAGCGPATVLSVAGRPCGRVVQTGPLHYVAGCDLQADCLDLPAAQARSMLAKAERLLAQVGGTLADVARTWMWLGNILDWYGEFNRARSDVFAARGLLKPDATGNLPASTGIGIGPVGDRCCAMDFCATLGGTPVQFLLGATRQGPASKYGSAFSRAAIADSPAGRTVYVSGTAAIDATGRTTHVGDARGQIEDTIENVRGALRDAGAQEKDVVQAVVYCRNREVEHLFRRDWQGLPMPYIVTIADVCREDLLFEIEATAMP